MANGFAEVEFLGNVGKDPVVKRLETTAGATVLAKFDIAISEGKSKDGEQHTSWFQLTAWGKTAEFVEKYVTSGSTLFVKATPKKRTYKNDKDETREIIDFTVKELRFAGSKRQNAPEQSGSIPF